MRCILGVDGGGTKTELILMNEDASVLLHRKIGCTNYEHLEGGFGELKILLKNTVLDMLHEADMTLSRLSYAVFGLAGADTGSQRESVKKAIQEIGIEHFLVCNDAFLPIKAGCEGGVGIASVNGTGCTVACIDKDGAQMQLGGMGQLTGDCGGGDYLGQRACAAVYAALYKKAEPTKMVSLLMREAHAEQESTLFDVLSDSLRAGRIRMRDINRIVFKAANEGDVAALGILRQMGYENARLIGSLVDRFSFKNEISVVLAGSIWQKGEHPAAIDELRHTVAMEHPGHKFRFEVLQQPPVVGAMLWAYELAWPEVSAAHMKKKMIESESYLKF